MGRPRRTGARRPYYDDWVKLAAQGWTQTEIGSMYGVTRQMVSVILIERGVDMAALRAERNVKRRAQRDAVAEAEMYQRVLDAMAVAQPCAVCGCWVLRRTGGSSQTRTCSSACAGLWVAARYAISEEEREHRRMDQARSILRHPETYKPSHLDWARRMLSDNPPPPNRRFKVPGSRASEIAEAVREGRL